MGVFGQPPAAAEAPPASEKVPAKPEPVEVQPGAEQVFFFAAVFFLCV